MALWSVRKFGWLELGFNEDYFIETLWRRRFLVQKYATPGIDLGTVYVACRLRDGFILGDALLWPDVDSTWAQRGTIERSRFSRSRPILPNPGGIATRLEVHNFAPTPKIARLTCGASRREVEIAPGTTQTVELETTEDQIAIESDLWTPDDFYHNGDRREVGVAIFDVRFIFKN